MTYPRITNSTVEALDILSEVSTTSESLLTSNHASKAGYTDLDQLFKQIQKDIEDARDRARKETIRLGILGGRGSGKSTLANALMGYNLLPESAIIFCTNLPTTIKFSRGTFLKVDSEIEEYNYTEKNISHADMQEILRTYCKESENPNNSFITGQF